jgi:phosphoglycolate phosphatase
MQLLFDLDGTLTDPLTGISRCIQHALARLGRPVPPTQALARFVGPPLRESFAQLLDTRDPERIEQAVTLYRERFAEVGLFENGLYPEIPDTLNALAQAGHRLWVVTSKPHVYAVRIVRFFQLSGLFQDVFGSELSGHNVDKRDLIREVLVRTGIDARTTWMIGDRAQDLRGGRANGTRVAGVLWGYGSEQELRQERPDALLANVGDLIQLPANAGPGAGMTGT